MNPVKLMNSAIFAQCKAGEVVMSAWSHTRDWK